MRFIPFSGREMRFMAALFVLCWICYWQATGFSFINFDDDVYVYQNPVVLSGLNFQSIKWAFTTDLNYWHPLTWLSHMADVEWYGLNSGKHHQTSILLHSLTVLACFTAMQMLGARIWVSVIAALLFAVHPSRIEPVVCVSSRKDVLSGLFVFLTVIAYAWYAKKDGDRKRFWIAYALFVCAMAAKPTRAVLPAALLLLDYWPLQRLSGKAWVEKALMLPASLIVSWLAYVGQSKIGAVVEQPALMQRFEIAIANAGAYLRRMVWPVPVSAVYPGDQNPEAWMIGLGLAILLAGTVAAVVLRKKAPYVFVGWFWYVVMLAPVTGFVVLGVQSQSDRFSYLPLFGIFLAVGFGLAEIWDRKKITFGTARMAGGVLAGVITVYTMMNEWYWHDAVSLMQQASAVTPESPTIWSNLGRAHEDLNQPYEAIKAYKRSLELSPKTLETKNSLGSAYAKANKFDEAVAEWDTLLKEAPTYARAWYNRAVVVNQMGKPNEAADNYRMAIKNGLPPNLEIRARSDLGALCTNSGEYAEALSTLDEAVKMDPQYIPARRNRAGVYLKIGRSNDALSDLMILQSLDPNDPAVAHALKQLQGGK